jgi:hypothetical protein
MCFRVERTRIRPPMIRLRAAGPTQFPQRLQLLTASLLASTKDLRQRPTAPVIAAMPELSLPGGSPSALSTRLRTPFVACGSRGVSGVWTRMKAQRLSFSALSTVRVLICNTRAVPHTPLAWRLSSLTCCVITRKRPLSAGAWRNGGCVQAR